MTKKPDQMEDIFERLKAQDDQNDFQNKQLEQILICLKGNPDLGFEGVIPAQKRMAIEMLKANEDFRRDMHEIRDQLSTEIKTRSALFAVEIEDLKKWKKKISDSLDFITSKRTWKFLFWGAVALVSVMVWVKFGWEALIQLATKIIKYN